MLGKDVDREEEAVSHAGAELAELERLVTARVAALTRPGPVLHDLAVRGFGGQLRPTPVNDNPVQPKEVRNARRS